jgi:nucleotide-binding universal stress UspA family protein
VKAILEGAVCDVLLVGGEVAAGLRPGPVLVPFAGGDHDWSAAELGAWLAAGSPLRLVGASGRGRDASRLLGSASLALQRAMGIPAEPVLVAPGAAAIVEAAAGAAAVVAGLSERWHREGIGAARSELAAHAPCPVLLVRRGLRPSGLAPPAALTHFAWSSGS